MPSRGGFLLTDDDRKLIALVFEYRMLRADHLARLTGRPEKKLTERLKLLVERRYLSRVRQPLQRLMYFLGSAGVDVLVERGLAPKELAEGRLRHQELKDLFLKHLLLIVDVHVALALAVRESAIRLVSWREGQELWNSVPVRGADGRRETLPVRPDAWFVLEDSRRPPGRNRLNFALEADRSTTSHERFARKLIAYWHYQLAGQHTAQHGVKSFRVVTVTLTEERAVALCALAEEALPPPARGFALFGGLPAVAAAGGILGELFLVPRDHREQRRHRLVPGPHQAEPERTAAAQAG